MSLFDSSSLVPPIALVALLELESEGFEHPIALVALLELESEGFEHLCGVLAICIWCIGLSSPRRIWFELLIGACPSWVLGTLDGLWPWWHCGLLWRLLGASN